VSAAQSIWFHQLHALKRPRGARLRSSHGSGSNTPSAVLLCNCFLWRYVIALCSKLIGVSHMVFLFPSHCQASAASPKLSSSCIAGAGSPSVSITRDGADIENKLGELSCCRKFQKYFSFLSSICQHFFLETTKASPKRGFTALFYALVRKATSSRAMQCLQMRNLGLLSPVQAAGTMLLLSEAL
jgi:hypothetical protein